MLRRASVLLVLASLTLVPDVASADSATAEVLYQKGRELMEKGKLEEACAAFASSLAEEQSAGTLLNLARCHQEQGKVATAWAEYRKAATLFRSRDEPRRADFATEQAEALQPQLPYLHVVVVGSPPAGLRVTRNGDEVPLPALGTDLPIDPGTIVITAEAPGFAPFRAEVDARAAGVHRVSIELSAPSTVVPAPRPDPVPTTAPTDGDSHLSGLQIAGLVVGGVGVASAIAGGVLGGLVLSDASDAESDPTLCPNRQCTPEGRAVIDEAEGKAIGANVLLGVGGAAAVGGLLMFLLAPDAPTEDVARITPRLSAREAGLDLRLSF